MLKVQYKNNNINTNEPRHDKTNKVTVRPAKTQISLGIRPVWSETSLCAQWVAKDQSFLHADSEDSDQTGRMPRLIWVFAGRTLILLVLSFRGLNIICTQKHGIMHVAVYCIFSVHSHSKKQNKVFIRAVSNEFVSSSIPSWQILTAHAQPFRGARDLAFCLKVPLDSLLVWASSEGSCETARMRRLAWTFAARIGDKYQIRLTRSIQYIVLYPHGIVLQVS